MRQAVLRAGKLDWQNGMKPYHVKELHIFKVKNKFKHLKGCPVEEGRVGGACIH